MRQARGYRIERVSAWFEGPASPVRPFRSTSSSLRGRSNLTFRVTDAAQHQYVLRRPPTSHVPATAHDMGREHRIIQPSADWLARTPALGLCDDMSVTAARSTSWAKSTASSCRTSDTRAHRFLKRAPKSGRVARRVLLHPRRDVDAVWLGNWPAERCRHSRWYGQYKESQGHSAPDVPEGGRRARSAL